MATTYDYIGANKRKSIVLMLAFVVFVIFLGWVIGRWTGDAGSMLVLASAVSLAMTLGGYFAGDKIALATSGAKGPITKEQNSYLWNLVENLGIAAGTPMPKLYVIQDPAINAFATGRDPKHASVAVTTGALEKLENEELEGVLAHELSHIRNYDVRYMMLILVLVNAVTLLARWFFWGGHSGRSNNDRNNGGNVFAIIGIVLLILSPIIAQLVQLAVSRRRELLADASGALLTRYPEGLARALEKIGQSNTSPMRQANDATAHLYFSNPFGRTKKVSGLFMTHPPIEERVAALRHMGGVS